MQNEAIEVGMLDVNDPGCSRIPMLTGCFVAQQAMEQFTIEKVSSVHNNCSHRRACVKGNLKY